jgi:hypothetical protein
MLLLPRARSKVSRGVLYSLHGVLSDAVVASLFLGSWNDLCAFEAVCYALAVSWRGLFIPALAAEHMSKSTASIMKGTQ